MSVFGKKRKDKRRTGKKLSKKRDIVIRYSIVLPIFVILFAAVALLSYRPVSYAVMPTGFSAATEEFPHGEVYSVYVDPKEPLMLEEFKINIGVRNPSTTLNEYLLEVLISKEGEVKDHSPFSFQLHPSKAITFSRGFTLTDAGKHEVVIKLYDKYKSVLYDTEILEITVLSDIGPFDLSLEAITRTVRPGSEVPLIVSMKNTGIKGTDVKISVSMDCLNQEDMHKDFSVFVKGGGEVAKSLTITACDEEGRRRINAKLVLFNHTFAESLNQIFLNRTYYEFQIETSRLVKIKQGESKIVDVYIKNTADITVSNLKLVVKDVPFEWTSTIPSIIISLRPNGTAVFLVNISIPNDAAVIEYPIEFAVGSDEMLVQKESTLKVISGDVAAPIAEARPLIDAYQYQLIIIIIAGATVLTVIVLLRRSMALKAQRRKKSALTKAKDMIR